MSSLLDQIQTGKQSRPRRIMVHGEHGIGKSTFAACAENPIFIATEDGLADLDCAQFPGVQASFASVMACLESLRTGEHNFHTVVIDSVDWLEKLIHADVCQQRGKKDIEDFGYAAGYKFAMTQWNQVIELLDALRNQRNMQIILIAHSTIEKFNNPETDPYDRYVPRLNKHASAYLQEWCDEVFCAVFKVVTKATDEGFNKKRTVGMGTGERVLRTTSRPAFSAKNRLNMPDSIPFIFSEYAKYRDGKVVAEAATA